MPGGCIIRKVLEENIFAIQTLSYISDTALNLKVLSAYSKIANACATWVINSASSW